MGMSPTGETVVSFRIVGCSHLLSRRRLWGEVGNGGSTIGSFVGQAKEGTER